MFELFATCHSPRARLVHQPELRSWLKCCRTCARMQHRGMCLKTGRNPLLHNSWCGCKETCFFSPLKMKKIFAKNSFGCFETATERNPFVLCFGIHPQFALSRQREPFRCHNSDISDRQNRSSTALAQGPHRKDANRDTRRQTERQAETDRNRQKRTETDRSPKPTPILRHFGCEF